MKIGFFTMPVHRLDKNYTECLKEDREAIILADKLGYSEAYVGEHVTDAAESITNSMLFQASLIAETTQIKLGTGTTNLSHTHPVLVAAQAAMMDHLLEGRFIFGISPGALESDAEALGIRGVDRNAMFVEAIDHIINIWTGEPPYDLTGDFWNITTRETQFAEIGLGPIAKPFQKPYPPIVGTVVAPFSKGVIEMGKKGFLPISANFLLAKWVETHWGNYAKGCEEGGRPANTDDWRVARSIFVHDDHQTAIDYGKANDRSPYRFYYKQLYTKLMKAGPPRGLQAVARFPGRPAVARLHPRRTCHLRRRQQRGRPDPGVPRGDRRFRHPALCRQGLGRQGTRQAVDGTDGREGNACGQCGDRSGCSLGTGFLK